MPDDSNNAGAQWAAEQSAKSRALVAALDRIATLVATSTDLAAVTRAAEVLLESQHAEDALAKAPG